MNLFKITKNDEAFLDNTKIYRTLNKNTCTDYMYMYMFRLMLYVLVHVAYS